MIIAGFLFFIEPVLFSNSVVRRVEIQQKPARETPDIELSPKGCSRCVSNFKFAAAAA